MKPGQPIRLRIHSAGKNRNLVVGAYTRGRLADTQKVAVKAGEPGRVVFDTNALISAAILPRSISRKAFRHAWPAQPMTAGPPAHCRLR